MSESDSAGERARLSTMFWLTYPLLLAWLWLIVSAVYAGSPEFGLKSLGIAVAAGVIAPVVWLVADWLRLVAMPDMFFSHGFLDTLSKKLFWAVGPQVLSLGLVGVGAYVAMGALSEAPKGKPQTLPPPSTVALVTPANASPAATPATSTSGSALSTSDNARRATLCTHPDTLRSLKASLVDAMGYRAKAVSGRDLSPNVLRSQMSIAIEDIETVPDPSPSGATCSALLSVQVSPDLAAYGLESFVEENSFIVYEAADGSISAEFPD